MDCIKNIEEICGELGEDLNSIKCLEIKKHLDECPTCCAYVDTLNKTVEIYKVLPDKDVPDSVHKKLWKVLKL